MTVCIRIAQYNSALRRGAHLPAGEKIHNTTYIQNSFLHPAHSLSQSMFNEALLNLDLQNTNNSDLPQTMNETESLLK